MSKIAPEIEAILTWDNVLVSVVALPDYHLQLTYSDGIVYDFDFNPVLAKGGVMDALRDPRVFSAVRIGPLGRSIEFPGEIDCCADGIRYEAELQKRGLPLPD